MVAPEQDWLGRLHQWVDETLKDAPYRPFDKTLDALMWHVLSARYPRQHGDSIEEWQLILRGDKDPHQLTSLTLSETMEELNRLVGGLDGVYDRQFGLLARFVDDPPQSRSSDLDDLSDQWRWAFAGQAERRAVVGLVLLRWVLCGDPPADDAEATQELRQLVIRAVRRLLADAGTPALPASPPPMVEPIFALPPVPDYLPGVSTPPPPPRTVTFDRQREEQLHKAALDLFKALLGHLSPKAQAKIDLLWLDKAVASPTRELLEQLDEFLTGWKERMTEASAADPTWLDDLPTEADPALEHRVADFLRAAQTPDAGADQPEAEEAGDPAGPAEDDAGAEEPDPSGAIDRSTDGDARIGDVSIVIGTDIMTSLSVAIPPIRRYDGLYILGKPGKGKSSLLEDMILQDITSSRDACIVIDPKRDLAEHVKRRIPPERQDDVIDLDIKNTACVFGLNLLDCEDPTDDLQTAEAVERAMRVFRRLWGPQGQMPSWGARMDELLENAAKTVIKSRGTLIDMADLLDRDDATARQRLVAALDPIRDRDVIRFWRQRGHGIERQQSDEVPPQHAGPAHRRPAFDHRPARGHQHRQDHPGTA
jgi:hypothetical protein